MQALDEQYAEALAHVADLAGQRQAYSEATTRLAGTLDPDDPGHPWPLPLAHAAAIAKMATWWTPRPAPVLAPPRPGMRRVKVLQSFRDAGGL